MKGGFRGISLISLFLSLLCLLPTTSCLSPKATQAPSAAKIEKPTPSDLLIVTTTADAGEGSLRAAIEKANLAQSKMTIRFDSINGPFAPKQSIVLKSPLPILRGELEIDGYIDGQLWKSTGVTLDGGGKFQVFEVAKGAKVTIRSLTIASGVAEYGGGIVNRGSLVVSGMTLKNNQAERTGGAIANVDGAKLTVINSTFYRNVASQIGGAISDDSGNVTLTNCTLTENQAPSGGGVFSTGKLLIRNSILANSSPSEDCVATGQWDLASTHNIIESHQGCGTPYSSADPGLGQLGGYNGPTETIPPGEIAINFGLNDAALDENGKRLVWDQRGNGDPRFAVGITDIGAFESQPVMKLEVDTTEDVDLRGCTAAANNCSLRGALILANARDAGDVITFDPKVFASIRRIELKEPLPKITAKVTLDATLVPGILIEGQKSSLHSLAQNNVILKELATKN